MERRNDIDLLKGIAIIAVVFYHVGLLPYGFLGVEIFLVVSGYLLIPKLTIQISSGDYKYFPWLLKRLYRIWPITLAASIVSLFLGYFLMIPDSYENLAESVVASNLFSNNILSAITTKNYWDTSNEYKPLMQMWYLGIIAQFYVLFPLLLSILHKCTSRYFKNTWGLISVIALGALSLLLYLLPGVPYTQKFYFIQYRIWEFAFGGAMGLLLLKSNPHFAKFSKYIFFVAVLIMLGLACYDFTSLSHINNVTIIGAPASSDTTYLKVIGTISMSIVTCIMLLSNVKIGGGYYMQTRSYVPEHICMASSNSGFYPI